MKKLQRVPQVVTVEVVRSHVMRVAFDDGVVRDIEYKRGRARPGGVFEPLEDPDYFASASVDHEGGTVAWPNGLDLAPEVLHGDYDFPGDGHFRHLDTPQPGRQLA